MLVSLGPTGAIELRVDGLDPEQKRKFAFSVPDGYTAVAVASAQNTGEYTVNGEEGRRG